MAGTDLIRLRCRHCEGSGWDVWGTERAMPPPYDPPPNPTVRLPDGRCFELDSDDTTILRCPSCLQPGVIALEDDD